MWGHFQHNSYYLFKLLMSYVLTQLQTAIAWQQQTSLYQKFQCNISLIFEF